MSLVICPSRSYPIFRIQKEYSIMVQNTDSGAKLVGVRLLGFESWLETVLVGMISPYLRRLLYASHCYTGST